MITATPINYLDLEYTSRHLKLKGWLYIVFILYARKKYHFIVNLGEELVPFHCYLRVEAPLFKESFGGGWSFFLIVPKTMLAVCWSLIFWSELYVEG